MYLFRVKESRIFLFGINIYMNHYIATVRIQGHSYRTGILADNPISARLLLQFMFGTANVISPPALSEDEHLESVDAIRLYTAENIIKPTTPTRPKTADQAEIANLQARVKQAQQAVKAARTRQQMIRAQRLIRKVI
jgi:hypothetical protein